MTELGSIKLVALRNFTNANQVNICAIMECNRDWNYALAHLQAATDLVLVGKQSMEHLTQYSRNKQSSIPTRQYGISERSSTN